MSHKANKARPHKVSRAHYKVANCPAYDRAFQQCGSLMVWVTPKALAAWRLSHTGQCGRPHDYSDLVIEAGHLLRLAIDRFGQSWRQTEELLRSLTALLGIDVGVPDHMMFSRRSPGLAPATALALAQASRPMHMVINATGLKVYSAGEWLVWKNTASAARRHGVSCTGPSIPSSGETLASELTTNEEGDTSQTDPLLEQIPGPITSVTAEGAHGGEFACQAEAARQLDSPMAGVIPPRSTLVPSPGGDTTPSLCDQHLLVVEDKGRIGWQRERRLRPAVARGTATSRGGDITGRGFRARISPAQNAGTKNARSVLNRMPDFGICVSQRVC